MDFDGFLFGHTSRHYWSDPLTLCRLHFWLALSLLKLRMMRLTSSSTHLSHLPYQFAMACVGPKATDGQTYLAAMLWKNWPGWSWRKREKLRKLHATRLITVPEALLFTTTAPMTAQLAPNSIYKIHRSSSNQKKHLWGETTRSIVLYQQSMNYQTTTKCPCPKVRVLSHPFRRQRHSLPPNSFSSIEAVGSCDLRTASVFEKLLFPLFICRQ